MPKNRDRTESDLPLKGFLTYRLIRLYAQLNAQATQYLSKYADVTLTEWRMIAIIGDSGESTMTGISREVGVDKALVSRTVKTLIDRKLIDAARDDNDHRVQRLSLTPAGKALFDRLLPRMQARQRFLRAALTPDELAALESAVDKLMVAAEQTEFPE